jgi:hypothetical protein
MQLFEVKAMLELNKITYYTISNMEGHVLSSISPANMDWYFNRHQWNIYTFGVVLLESEGF